jgi:UDP-glucuronate decarboxylase
VVSNFIVQALNEEPLTIFGDGSQTRSFCYITDLVDGLVRLMETPDDFSGPVNLGNPHEFTMLELAESIIGLTGSTSSIVHHPLPTDDPIRRKPDIALAEKHLGWQPKVPLEAGLQQTIAYFSGMLMTPASMPTPLAHRISPTPGFVRL